MSIRRNARIWLSQRGVALTGALYTSKLYDAAQSWTGAPAWWIQVPLERLQSEKAIEMLCESEVAGIPFRHLTVPTTFLQKNISGFGLIGDKSINLFLSAEPRLRFTDLRGPARIDFSPFVHEHVEMGRQTLDDIVAILAAQRQRATYGAVAALLDRPAHYVMQGAPRTHFYSWVVNAESHLPTGYTDEEMDPHLLDKAEVIMTEADLVEWLRFHTS